MHTIASGEHQLGGGAIHAVSGANKFTSRTKDRRFTGRGVFVALVDAENSSGGHVAVDVGGPVQWVKDDAVLACSTVISIRAHKKKGERSVSGCTTTSQRNKMAEEWAHAPARADSTMIGSSFSSDTMMLTLREN